MVSRIEVLTVFTKRGYLDGTNKVGILRVHITYNESWYGHPLLNEMKSLHVWPQLSIGGLTSCCIHITCRNLSLEILAHCCTSFSLLTLLFLPCGISKQWYMNHQLRPTRTFMLKPSRVSKHQELHGRSQGLGNGNCSCRLRFFCSHVPNKEDNTVHAQTADKGVRQ